MNTLFSPMLIAPVRFKWVKDSPFPGQSRLFANDVDTGYFIDKNGYSPYWFLYLSGAGPTGIALEVAGFTKIGEARTDAEARTLERIKAGAA